MKDAIVEFGVRKTAGKKAGREKNPVSFFIALAGWGRWLL